MFISVACAKSSATPTTHSSRRCAVPGTSLKTVSRRYVDSSSFKMALLFTALLAISATILIYLVIDFGRRDLLRETRAAIDIEISLLSRLNDVPGELVAYIQSRTE